MNENSQELQTEFESARSMLRNRWELASVLNFFKVFEPLIESNLKISAEEIETALILPNKSLAQLHISLLKGIPPVGKNLKDPDVWVVTLSKKLKMWWPWVAEGDFPLTAAKGAEMTTYKEFDPTTRLLILKALCEIRADQHDAVSYINDAVKNKNEISPSQKNKNEISTFQKNKIGEDGKGISYWLDGNETIGLRLYKEVNTFRKKGLLPTINSRWETLATNLEEFKKVVDEYSNSKSKVEITVSVAIETEAIPILNKLLKKQERALQKKKNEERVVNNFCRSGITRACRSRTPISYTFDAYDKAIDEAIRETKKMKSREEKRSEKKENEDLKQVTDDGESTESDSESNKHENEDASEEEESDENDDDNTSQNGDVEMSEKKETVSNEAVELTDDKSTDSDSESEDSSEEEQDESNNQNMKENNNFIKKTIKTTANGNAIQENFGTKKQLRQRPNRNTAMESLTVPDSEDEMLSENSG